MENTCRPRKGLFFKLKTDDMEFSKRQLKTSSSSFDVFYNIGDSSLLASGKQSWMHGSESFYGLLSETFSIFQFLIFWVVDLRSALINFE